MVNFFLRHGMVVDKVHAVIPFEQSKWLEKNLIFKTKKRNRAKTEFEKDFCKLINNGAFGKFLENVRNRLIIFSIKSCEYNENIKQQSKVTFKGIQKPYTNSSSYTIKQNEVTMDKPIFVGFAILELSELCMYETYYDELQPNFGQDNLQLHYVDTDGEMLSIKTEITNKDLKNLEDLLGFSNMDGKHELFSNKNKKILGKFKIETTKNIIIDGFVALRSKM